MDEDSLFQESSSSLFGEDTVASFARSVDFIHGSVMGMAFFVLVAETVLQIRIPRFNSLQVMKMHELPADKDISNLEHFWFRSQGSFRVPMAIMHFLSLFGFISINQRRIIWLLAALFHFFEFFLIHLVQILKPKIGKGFISYKRHYLGVFTHPIPIFIFMFLFFYYRPSNGVGDPQRDLLFLGPSPLS